MSDDNAARDNVIREWMVARDAARNWTAREMELRLFICQNAFGYNHAQQGTINDGTHRVDLGNNYKLKLVTGTDWSVKDGPALDAALLSIRSMSGGYVKLDAALNHKWGLNKRGFDASEAEIKRLILPALESRNRSPQLDVEGVE